MVALNFLPISIITLLGLLFTQTKGAPTARVNENIPGDIINALKLGLVTQINAFITLDSLTTNLISVNFEVKNPLILELTLDRVVTTAGLNGTTYASFDHTFPTGFIVPALASANSGTFGNVSLTQGAVGSLGIIPYGELDLLNVDVYLRGGTINGQLGIPIPVLGLVQSDVNTTYSIDLS